MNECDLEFWYGFGVGVSAGSVATSITVYLLVRFWNSLDDV